jgi:hypothetical protein
MLEEFDFPAFFAEPRTAAQLLAVPDLAHEREAAGDVFYQLLAQQPLLVTQLLETAVLPG